jgi:hypothetical protein
MFVHVGLPDFLRDVLPRKAISPRSARDKYFVGRGHCKLAAPFASFTASINAGWT